MRLLTLVILMSALSTLACAQDYRQSRDNNMLAGLRVAEGSSLKGFDSPIVLGGHVVRLHTASTFLYNLSVASLMTSEILDSTSSHGLYETNSVLGRGAYGYRQDLVKFGLVSGAIYLQRYTVKRHPRVRSTFAVLNFVITGLTTGAAVHNFKLR